MNFVSQGSAADIVKYSMKEIYRLSEENHLDSTLIIQIHDQLVYEVLEEQVKDVALIVKKVMEGCVDLDVPLKIKLSIGQSWGELAPLIL